ncbi:MAG: UDP-N-acetylmuramoyl-L-alanyl-D-glutamate--2,6-diaminopimelate ligase [Alphaproteobacteria bacterium]|nr:UDP-N-acetylmuramoyl-L-alanyl-D-glutamate--2,6-diaminopimelate ligase [Alphaproteobacteria bacterium]
MNISLPDMTKFSGISSDSRQIKSGYMFVAIPGAKLDGRDFIKAAIENGAMAVVVPTGTPVESPNVEVIETDNPRAYLCHAAAAFYNAKIPYVAAVTGTNGKTSTVHFARELWKSLHEKAASLGTLGMVGEGLDGYSGMTTPDPVWLHQSLKNLADKGFTHLAMEASSIGIEQYRLDDIGIKAAGFTNLTRDHLDYHGTMEKYLDSKMRLFSELLDNQGIAIVNADVPEFENIRQFCEQRKIPCWGYGVKGKEITLKSREIFPQGQKIELEVLGQNFSVMLPLVGLFQTMNVLCALGLVLAENKFDVADVVNNLSHISSVPGRLQQVQGTKEFAVYVDYAHTPDALENILNALRPHTENRLICLFGCGGDRDTGKRPVMGDISTRLADVTIVTDDNPRSENPQEIRADILKGCQEQVLEIDGRRNAIRQAVQMLRKGDVLVLAGKGHEQGQIFATHTEPFDDVTETEAALREAPDKS